MWVKMEGIKQRADTADQFDEEREQLLSDVFSQEYHSVHQGYVSD